MFVIVQFGRSVATPQSHLSRINMTNLDIAALPHNPIWRPGTNAAVALNPIVLGLKPVIDKLMELGMIPRKESFGYALATPEIDHTQVWDNPQQLIGLVAYWGPEGPRYAANACRKIRAAAREGVDTEVLRRARPETFRDIVESKEGDTEFPWGDFPFDGAAYSIVQHLHLLGAVSALPKEQDPIIARFITEIVGYNMFLADKKLGLVA